MILAHELYTSEELKQIKEAGLITQEELEKPKKPRSPRIGFEITEAQRDALKRFTPWGNVTALYQAITADLIELFEKHGSAKVLAALISRQVKIYEISKTLLNTDDSTRT